MFFCIQKRLKEKLMEIEWREDMAVGDPMIDQDHQHLIELLNKYQFAVASKDLELLKNVFAELHTYTDEHFKREETLQRAIHFKEANSHHNRHQELLNEVVEIHENLVKGISGTISLDYISQLLHDWLIDHVIKEDLKMRPYLQGKPVTDIKEFKIGE